MCSCLLKPNQTCRSQNSALAGPFPPHSESEVCSSTHASSLVCFLSLSLSVFFQITRYLYVSTIFYAKRVVFTLWVVDSCMWTLTLRCCWWGEGLRFQFHYKTKVYPPQCRCSPQCLHRWGKVPLPLQVCQSLLVPLFSCFNQSLLLLFWIVIG